MRTKSENSRLSALFDIFSSLVGRLRSYAGGTAHALADLLLEAGKGVKLVHQLGVQPNARANTHESFCSNADWSASSFTANCAWSSRSFSLVGAGDVVELLEAAAPRRQLLTLGGGMTVL